jgi:hypothetical protein
MRVAECCSVQAESRPVLNTSSGPAMVLQPILAAAAFQAAFSAAQTADLFPGYCTSHELAGRSGDAPPRNGNTRTPAPGVAAIVCRCPQSAPQRLTCYRLPPFFRESAKDLNLGSLLSGSNRGSYGRNGNELSRPMRAFSSHSKALSF